MVTPPVPEPQRRVVQELVLRTVEVNGVSFVVVWHGAIEGHWSETKGGICVR